MTFKELKIEANELVLEGEGVRLPKYQALKKKFDKYEGEVPSYIRNLNVAFLASYTIQGLPDAIVARGLFHNLNITSYEADYNQFSQMAFQSSSAYYLSEPNVTYLFLDAPDILDESHLESVIRSILENSKSYIVIISFVEGPSTDAKKVISLNGVLNELAKTEKRVHVFDLAQFLESHTDVWYTKYVELGDLRINPSAFPLLAEAMLGYAVAVSGNTRKCIVTDLDNTLWEGIVGEDGASNVVPNAPLQKVMVEHKKVGAVLAINSKNNEADAMEVIENHPNMVLKKKDFSAMRINWNQKDVNIAELATELNLGTDSFVFVDDDAFQQHLVLNRFPEIAVMHPDHFQAFSGFMKGVVSEEDARRSEMYQEEEKRQEAKQIFTSEEDYLKSLKLTARIGDMKEENKERVVQLTQKTNQYNMTTWRLTDVDLEAFLEKGGAVSVLHVDDVFGKYGLVGVLFLEMEGEEAVVKNLLMSCRVIGRGVEHAFLNEAVRKADNLGAKRIVGKFVSSPKNELAHGLYKNHGFELKEEKEEGELWVNEDLALRELPNYISVIHL